VRATHGEPIAAAAGGGSGALALATCTAAVASSPCPVMRQGVRPDAGRAEAARRPPGLPGSRQRTDPSTHSLPARSRLPRTGANPRPGLRHPSVSRLSVRAADADDRARIGAWRERS